MKQKRKSSKESSVSLFNRYVWLIETIQRAGSISYEEINEKWTSSHLNPAGDDMPIRTFHNHRKAIEEMFDIIIECDRRAGYVYKLEEDENIKRNKLKRWLLNSFSVGNLLAESRMLSDRILFEDVPSGHLHLTQLLESIREYRIVSITYQSFVQAAPYTVDVAPYCLKMFRQRWYLLAKNNQKNELRTYSLDRILTIKTSTETYIYPQNFCAHTYFSNSFGIMTENEDMPESILIKVYGGQKYYFKTLPLHHSQTFLKESDEFALLQVFVHITYDFIQELLSHGSSIEILQPMWLRAEFSDRVKETAKLYECEVSELKSIE